MQRDLEHPRMLSRLLRELPDETAPPYGWSEFQRRASRRAAPHRDSIGSRSLAVLAVIVAGILALTLRLGEPLRPALHPPQVAADGGSGVVDSSFREAPADTMHSELRTQRLERWLASFPDEPALVRVGNRAAVTGLEDRLAEVDDLLTVERIDQAQPARLLALQQERRRLVSSLAQVRYAQTLADAAR
jgi:hypothetical protein